MAGLSRLVRSGIALTALAALGIALFLILQSQIAQSSAPGTPREFTVNNDGVTCPHTVTFQGKTVNQDGSTTWSYLLVNKDGQGCGTSHWVLQMCQASPSVYDAFVKANPNGTRTSKSGDPSTGIVGVKWNDIQNGYTDPPGGKFTLRLNQDFAIAKNVPLAIKVGTVTDGVIYGNIEGPDCQAGPGEQPSVTPTDTPVTPTDTPTPTYTDTPVTPPTITPTYTPTHTATLTRTFTPTRTSTPTDTATPTYTPEIPFGGIGAYPDSGGLPLETAESSGGGGALFAAMLMAGGTAVAIALGGAAWYARRLIAAKARQTRR